MSTKWEDWLLFGGEMPTIVTPEVPQPDVVYFVDKKTGCYFYGNKLIHTNECMCGEYEEDIELDEDIQHA